MVKDYELLKFEEDDFFHKIPLNGKPVDPETLFGKYSRFMGQIYFKHSIYDKVAERISSGKITCILGHPLSGKTRIIYESLSKMNGCRAIIPKYDSAISEYKITISQNDIFIIDEIDNYLINNPNAIQKLLASIIQNGLKCIVTCRIGPEYFAVTSLLRHDLVDQLHANRITIPKLQKSDILSFIKEHPQLLNSDSFYDGNIGSLILPLRAMKERYEKLRQEDQRTALAILIGLKLHYHFFNYESRKSYFDETKIRLFCDKFLGYRVSSSDWIEAKRLLLSTDTDLNFIVDDTYLIIEEAYLDCHEKSSLDVVAEEFNFSSLRREFNLLYKTQEERDGAGFPGTTTAWNSLLLKTSSYDECLVMFRQIPENIRNLTSYFALLKKASNKDDLMRHYKEIREKFKVSEAGRNRINSIFYRKFNEFNELLEIISETNQDHFLFKTHVAQRLIALSKVSPKKNLHTLFTKFTSEEVFNGYVLIEICHECCHDEDDFMSYIQPYLESAKLLDIFLLKRFVSICLKLKKHQLCLDFITCHFSDDVFFYYYIKAGIFEALQPYNCLDLYEKSISNDPTENELLLSISKIVSIIYEKSYFSRYQLAIRHCQYLVNNKKIRHNLVPFVRHYYLLIEIALTPILMIEKKLTHLLRTLGAGRNSILTIYGKIKDPEKKELINKLYNCSPLK